VTEIQDADFIDLVYPNFIANFVLIYTHSRADEFCGGVMAAGHCHS
jgi:hypothetical protein